jgi:hypothetical protein
MILYVLFVVYILMYYIRERAPLPRLQKLLEFECWIGLSYCKLCGRCLMTGVECKYWYPTKKMQLLDPKRADLTGRCILRLFRVGVIINTVECDHKCCGSKCVCFGSAYNFHKSFGHIAILLAAP